jgi:hypothetical protein
MVEEGVSSEMFLWENCDSFCKDEYMCPNDLKRQYQHLCANSSIQVNGRSTVSLANRPFPVNGRSTVRLSREPLMFQARGPSTLLSSEN